jgi:hypothetical protein
MARVAHDNARRWFVFSRTLNEWSDRPAVSALRMHRRIRASRLGAPLVRTVHPGDAVRAQASARSCGPSRSSPATRFARDALAISVAPERSFQSTRHDRVDEGRRCKRQRATYRVQTVLRVSNLGSMMTVVSQRRTRAAWHIAASMDQDADRARGPPARLRTGAPECIDRPGARSAVY